MKSIIIKILAIFFLLMSASISWAVDGGNYFPTILPDTANTVWTLNNDGGSGSGGADFTFNGSSAFLYINGGSEIYDLFRYENDLSANNATETIEIEFRVKLLSYSGDGASCAVSFANDVNKDALMITPSGIELHVAGDEYKHEGFDPMDGYHTYKIVAANNKIDVYVDGSLKIDYATFSSWTPSYNYIRFGDTTRGGSAESSWEYIEYEVYSNP